MPEAQIVIIKRLVLRNWQAYADEHALELRPLMYAAVARYALDPARSSGGGKSALVDAIPFALYGWLNPAWGFGHDGWITDGSREGFVRVECDDGWWAERRGQEGKKPRIVVASGAKDEDAQREIEQRVGYAEEDFFAAPCVRQREAARFVLAPPKDRTEVVGAWFRLGKLEAGEERAKQLAGELEAEEKKLLGMIEQTRQLEDGALGGRTFPQLEEALRREEHRLAGYRDAAARQEGELGRLRERRADWALVAQHDAAKHLVEQLRHQPGEQIDRELGDAQRAMGTLSATCAMLQADLQKKQELVGGRFDGRCPVAGIDCPARDQINAQVAHHARQRDVAKLAHDAARKTLGEAQEQLSALRVRKQASDERARAVGQARERELRLRDKADAARAAGEPPAEDQLRAVIEETRAALARAEDQVTVHRANVELVRRMRDQRAKHERRLEQLAKELGTRREAVAVYRAARRRVAEGALAEVEALANAGPLAASETGLTLELRWSREAAGLAKACDKCGAPFPQSARAKQCDRCGAQRGQHRVNKLDVLLNQQSGGLQDLAGLGVQLAASSWLRDDRAAAWATALLDEPLGQMDAAIRRAVGAKLPAMLRACGFEQAIVVSHTAETLNAMEGQLLIEHSGGRSKVRVL